MSDGPPLLDRTLRQLHGHGYWIEAWYPLTPKVPPRGRAEQPRWECRITNGTDRQWAEGTEAMTVLLLAMRKAGLRA